MTSDLARGVRATLPLGVSVIVYGLVFGVLAREAGMNCIDAALMSLLVNAGGSQFVAIGLWSSQMQIGGIILATLVVNLRHILMGASLRNWLVYLPVWKMYSLAFFISDESWVLTMLEYEKYKRTRSGARFLLGSGLTLWSAWVLATTVGYQLGLAISKPVLGGLEFAFIAVIITLLVKVWGGKSSLMPWVTSASVALLAIHWLPDGWYILLGGLAGFLVGVIQNEY